MQDILLIGKNNQFYKSLNLALDTDYYKVTMLSAGKEAGLYVKEQKPDFIIFDENLSDEDTIYFIKSIREYWKALPIIIVRSKSNNKSIVNYYNADISDVLFRSGLVCSTFLQILEKIRKVEQRSLKSNNKFNDKTKNIVDFAKRDKASRLQALSFITNKLSLCSNFC